jgi:hypothetical protein
MQPLNTYRHKISLLQVILLIFSLWACKPKTDVLTNDEISINILEKNYFEQPIDSLFQQLMTAIGREIVSTEKTSQKINLIERAIRITEKAKQESYRQIFITEYLKANPNGPKQADYLYETAEYRLYSKRKEVASILFSAFIMKYPEDKRVEEAKKHIIPQQRDMAYFMRKSAESVLIQPDSTGIHQKAAMAYIDHSEAHALGFAEDANSPVYLFTAAEFARTLRQLPKMMTLYDWIIQYYPTFNKSSLVLFLKGFTLESEFVRIEDARNTYTSFLTKYPKDSLAGDVRLLLELLGKNADDIIGKSTKPNLQ